MSIKKTPFFFKFKTQRRLNTIIVWYKYFFHFWSSLEFFNDQQNFVRLSTKKFFVSTCIRKPLSKVLLKTYKKLSLGLTGYTVHHVSLNQTHWSLWIPQTIQKVCKMFPYLLKLISHLSVTKLPVLFGHG